MKEHGQQTETYKRTATYPIPPLSNLIPLYYKLEYTL